MRDLVVMSTHQASKTLLRKCYGVKSRAHSDVHSATAPTLVPIIRNKMLVLGFKNIVEQILQSKSHFSREQDIEKSMLKAVTP